MWRALTRCLHSPGPTPRLQTAYKTWHRSRHLHFAYKRGASPLNIFVASFLYPPQHGSAAVEITIKLNRQQEADLKAKVTREISSIVRECAGRIVERLIEPHTTAIKKRVRELTTDPAFVAEVAAHVLSGKSYWREDD